jgi:hypothetical protein
MFDESSCTLYDVRYTAEYEVTVNTPGCAVSIIKGARPKQDEVKCRSERIGKARASVSVLFD